MNFHEFLKCQRILRIKFAEMNYSKRLEIFLAHLQIKLDRTARIERSHGIARITA